MHFRIPVKDYDPRKLQNKLVSISKMLSFNFIKVQLRDKGNMKKTWVWRYDVLVLQIFYCLIRLEERSQGLLPSDDSLILSKRYRLQS